MPIDQSFVDAADQPRSRLGRVVHELLELGLAGNSQHFYAWDPLAAVSVVQPAVSTTERLGITIVTTTPEAGRTKLDLDSSRRVSVAVAADAEEFRKTFLNAFSHSD